MVFSFTSQWNSNSNWAAIISKEAELRSGPGVNNALVFKLHEGAPVFIEDSQNSWHRISISDGKTAWVKSQDIKVF